MNRDSRPPKAPSPLEIAVWSAEYFDRIERTIREHGVFIQYVGGDRATRSTSFAYTIGLHQLGHPELLVLGVSQDTVGGLLNEVAARVRGGTALAPNDILSFDEWPHRVAVEVVPNPEEILLMAMDSAALRDSTPIRAFQLTTDDRQGRFPWDDGYDVPAWIQPRPGEFRA